MNTTREHVFSPEEQAVLKSFFESEEKLNEIHLAFEQYNKLMAYYKCAIMEIETKFNVLNEQFSLMHDRMPINGIKSRLKSLDSISKKLKRRGLPVTLKSIE